MIQEEGETSKSFEGSNNSGSLEEKKRKPSWLDLSERGKKDKYEMGYKR